MVMFGHEASWVQHSRGKATMIKATHILCACLVVLLAAGCGSKKAPKDVRRASAIAKLPAGDNNQTLRQFVQEAGLEGLKKILEQAKDESDDEFTRARMVAITGLGMLRGNAEATQILLDFVEGDDSEAAHWAIIALGYQKAPEAKDAITAMMKSDDPHRRAGACMAIKEYGDASLYPLLDAAAADDPDPKVRKVAEKARLLIQQGQVVTEGKRPAEEQPDVTK